MIPKVKILACHTLSDEIQSLLPEGVECEFLEYFLHRVPAKLQAELQKRIDATTDAEIILLGYGLCSNGVVDLRSARQRLVIPRVHDCISLLLGSAERYAQEFEANPATVYLSKGWIEHEGEPLAEYQRYVKQYGEAEARWIIDEQYKNYTRVAFIDTGLGDLEPYRRYSCRVAEFLKVRHQELPGSTELLRRLVQGQWDRDFLVLEPGQAIKQRFFL